MVRQAVMEGGWIISTKVKLNIFLIFGIDYRPFLKTNSIEDRCVSDALHRIDYFSNLFILYGDCVFPHRFQKLLNYEKLVEMRKFFLKKEYRSQEATIANEIVFAYLSDVLGPLLIKKAIPTSVKVMCCNELGISEEVFDSYVCYREIRDTDVKLYPYYCD